MTAGTKKHYLYNLIVAYHGPMVREVWRRRKTVRIVVVLRLTMRKTLPRWAEAWGVIQVLSSSSITPEVFELIEAPWLADDQECGLPIHWRAFAAAAACLSHINFQDDLPLEKAPLDVYLRAGGADEYERATGRPIDGPTFPGLPSHSACMNQVDSKRNALMRSNPHSVLAPEWSDCMKAIDAAGQRVVARLPEGATIADKFDAYSIMLGALSGAYFILLRNNPSHPEFVPWLGLHFNLTAPNPDTTYLNAAIDSAGTYRIVGRVGKVLMMLLQVQGPSQFVHNSKEPALGNYELTGLPRGPDGDFELILGANRPEDYTGEWRPLDSRAELLTVRWVSDDWAGEGDPKVAIERIDVPARASRRPVAEIETKMPAIAAYIENSYLRWIDYVAALRNDGYVNKLRHKSYENVPGVSTQSYYDGVFDLREDEALILETEMPSTCQYWSIALADEMYHSLDWANNQISLNCSQAHLDSDARLRVVIAHSDPSVPNWLDTVDRNCGLIRGRWGGASSSPLPSTRKVDLARVREFLPSDTPVVSREERDNALRARRQAYHFRRKW
jgi:hypothetical protein